MENKKKSKCESCGKERAKGIILVGKKQNHFICEKCWKGAGKFKNVDGREE